MKQTLNYGRITWGYDDFEPSLPCIPTPLVSFSPIRFNGKVKYFNFTDRQSLELLKYKTDHRMTLREAYGRWPNKSYQHELDLGESRAFIKWLKDHKVSIKWSPQDYSLHQYFNQKNSPTHLKDDEFSLGQSFSISPLVVNKRVIKLYLEDESILNLLSLTFGEEENFFKLIESYILLRFQLVKWNAPAPLFIDWLRASGKRPIFHSGQMGFCLKP
jgi:hypothetical protein